MLTEVLGLSKIDGGRDIMTFIQLADTLRKVCLPVLKVLGAILRGIIAITLAFQKLFSRSESAAPVVMAEPRRDGGLR